MAERCIHLKRNLYLLLALYGLPVQRQVRAYLVHLASFDARVNPYCRGRGVLYLALPHPAYVPATAATIGIDPELYRRTRLARRTVWSRLYLGEHIAGFTLVSDGAISIWKIE